MHLDSLFTKLKSALLLSLLAAICLAATSTAAVPTGAGLDQTFGSKGVTQFQSVAGKNTAVEICEPAANGRILVGGIGSNRMLGDGIDPGGGNVWIGWLTSSGKPVRRFGRNGVLTKLPIRGARLRSVAPAGNGKTLAIVSRKVKRRTYASIMRLTSTGTLDRSFSTDGRVGLGTMTSKSSFSLIPAGENLFLHIRHREHSVLKRLLNDGTTDPSFTSVGFGPQSFSLTGAAPLADGSVIVWGQQAIDTKRSRSIIQKLRPDGSADASWANGGSHIVETTPESVAIDLSPTAPPLDLLNRLESVHARDVTVLADGRVVIQLNTYTTTGYGDPVWAQRLLADGQLDNSFGTAGSLGLTYGTIVFDGGGGDYTWSWNEFAPDGSHYSGYFAELDGEPSFGISRRDVTGSPDISFTRAVNLGRSSSWVQNVRVDPSNSRVIGCGFTSRSRPYLATGYVFAISTR